MPPLLPTLLLLAQLASGQLLVTVEDTARQPVAATEVAFRAEGHPAPLARCTTDATGQCTLGIIDGPADASGLLRGTLLVGGGGERPLIWPGGPLALTVTLDEAGHVATAHDHYATRVPGPPAATQRAELATTVAALPTLPPTTLAPSATAPVRVVADLTPTTATVHESSLPTTEQATRPAPSLPLLLAGILILGFLAYAWLTYRGETP